MPTIEAHPKTPAAKVGGADLTPALDGNGSPFFRLFAGVKAAPKKAAFVNCPIKGPLPKCKLPKAKKGENKASMANNDAFVDITDNGTTDKDSAGKDNTSSGSGNTNTTAN